MKAKVKAAPTALLCIKMYDIYNSESWVLKLPICTCHYKIVLYKSMEFVFVITFLRIPILEYSNKKRLSALQTPFL